MTGSVTVLLLHGLHLMSALISLVPIPTIPRRQRAAVTVALGLSVGL